MSIEHLKPFMPVIKACLQLDVVVTETGETTRDFQMSRALPRDGGPANDVIMVQG